MTVEDPHRGPAGPDNRVLVLEDDPSFGAQVTRLAGELGMASLWVPTVSEFKEAYDAFLPSVLVLDIVLGEEDVCPVLDFLVDMRCSAPLILLSAHDERLRQFVASLGRGLLVADTIGKREGFKRLAIQLNAYRVG